MKKRRAYGTPFQSRHDEFKVRLIALGSSFLPDPIDLSIYSGLFSQLFPFSISPAFEPGITKFSKHIFWCFIRLVGLRIIHGNEGIPTLSYHSKKLISRIRYKPAWCEHHCLSDVPTEHLLR